MSEPTCANCPKGLALHGYNRVQCRAHPPTPLLWPDKDVTSTWPCPQPHEVCHEHPTLEEAERVGIERRMEPAHEWRSGPRDMCELEEGGKDGA